MRRRMYPNRMKYDYLLPLFFLVGSYSNILHSFKLKAASLMLCSSHTVTQTQAVTHYPGAEKLPQTELDLHFLETLRVLSLEGEGVVARCALRKRK